MMVIIINRGLSYNLNKSKNYFKKIYFEHVIAFRDKINILNYVKYTFLKFILYFCSILSFKILLILSLKLNLCPE